MTSKPVIEIENLTVRFNGADGNNTAVEDVSFKIGAGETLCLVGESGSGKSVTSLSVIDLLGSPHASRNAEVLRVCGENLLDIRSEKLRKIRSDKVSMIFQEPMTAMNPVMKVGEQVAEIFIVHKKLSFEEARSKTIDLFEQVRIPEAEKRFESYPHQLSGGLKQRVMIAMAMACEPELLIADEPTTALDVSVQAQILCLLSELQEKFGTALLFITHDLGVVAQIADRVAVMYCGRIVESASVYEIFESPKHPYTKALLDAMPSRQKVGVARFSQIRGRVPNINARPEGCYFRGRCDHEKPECAVGKPPLRQLEGHHEFLCQLEKGVPDE